MRCSRLSMSCVVILAMLLTKTVSSQETTDAYPGKPVVVIVATAPGGPQEQETRLYATKLSGLLGQTFLVDFKPGAGGTIGTAYVAKARPDGYTLLTTSASFTAFPPLYRDLPFDIIKDFAPVSQMSQRTSVLMVGTSFPAKTFTEYLAYAKANPGKINYGTTGAGGVIHLAGAWLHSATNTKVTFIHYKGSAPQMLDLQAGRLDVVTSALVSGLQLIKAGKVRALAIMNDEPSKLLPGIPTIAERGVPGYNFSSWLGIVAPGATPPAIVNKLSEGLAKVAKMPDVAAIFDAEGNMLVGGTPAQFRQVIVAEAARWQKVVQDNGIKFEQ